MNRLQHSSSPYLLQHAANPVDWYPWGEEALQLAKSANKPILVSIGYSTCHWCHVMQREAFENKEVADYMNALFVCIKVDREERPDLDAIYMDACEIIAGTAGWPLNIFLTPDLKPFHGGTYFPPQTRNGLPSWMDTLNFVAYNYYENRDAVLAQAEKVIAKIKGSDEQFVSLNPAVTTGGNDVFLKNVWKQIYKGYDKKNGGFGDAPKFPNLLVLSFLQKMDYYYPDAKIKAALDDSLRKMLNGGIYDQIGGGIARYAIDRAWMIPHFEKMLYDNALLAQLLAQKYKQNKDSFFLGKLEQTLAFIIREMMGEHGGFFSALDADTDGVEGAFYTWAYPEFAEALGQDAKAMANYWNVTKKGNWDGTNILWTKEPSPSKPQVALIKEAITKLLTVRNKRKRPHRDEKVLTNWNSLMCKGFVLAYQATGDPTYKQVAIKNIQFLLAKLIQPDGHLFHVWMNGQASISGVLSDYALLADALLAVYELDFDPLYLEAADDLVQVVLAEFQDSKSELFFATSKHQKDVVVRKKDLYDTEFPSGNAQMLAVLNRLGVLLDKPDYCRKSERMMAQVQESLQKHPMTFPFWLSDALDLKFGLAEITVIGDNALTKAQNILNHYIPNYIIAASTTPSQQLSLLKGKKGDKDAWIYLCKDFACQRPVKKVAELGW